MDNTDEIPDKWEKFCFEVKKRAEKTRAVAEKYNLSFIPLQSKFDEVAKDSDNTYWLIDGVHPTPMGHELIKCEWLKAYEQIV